MKTRLLEFDYLRALAIMLIVLGHSVYNTEKGFPLILENIVRGGTAVFVFISGFFLHAVFSKNFELRSFMIKKIKNVYVPFLIVTLLGLLCRIFGWSVLLDEPLEKVLLNIYYTVKNGYVLYPHWYIPFIMAVFLLSPIYLAFMRIPFWHQILFLALLTILSIFLHRPHGNANVFHSILYYTPFYLVGIMYSMYRPWFEKYAKIILAIALLGTALSIYLQTYVWLWIGNYHKYFFEYKGVDLQFIQKMGLCFIFLAISKFLAASDKDYPWLKEVGDLSFAIFFIHPLFTMLIENIFPILGIFTLEGGAVLSISMTALMFCIHLYGSFYTARMIKKALPNYSRTLIGT